MPLKPPAFLIVGIGASAGGIQAIKQFFEQVPADSGMAYIVILHLSPDHDSQLAEIIQTVTSIPVIRVEKATKVEQNRVYVIPPNSHLKMEDGHLTVSANIHLEERRAPVDIFFRSLAESHGTHAVCVVLSGTGANGSMGLKRIKEEGGLALVQDPNEAEFSEMPRHSIETGLVDEVLPVSLIPGKIIDYGKNFDAPTPFLESGTAPENEQKALQLIFNMLRVRTGHDFTDYKRPTLLRRIARRVYIRNQPDMAAYSRLVQDEPEEARALLKDILISVTGFFRDRSAFEYLKTELLPEIFHGKTEDDEVRIWVAGCATGEEAYSIAILCAEHTAGKINMPKVQIFATDIDDAAIAKARDGLYTINDAAYVSPERLSENFVRDIAGYRIKRELREMVLFASHNFLKNPPFSRLDLVTCRNVLIYLNQAAQHRLMETFHFALNANAFLFVGTSESIDGAGHLYNSFKREHHIFQSRAVRVKTSYPVPEFTPRFHAEPDRFQNNSVSETSRVPLRQNPADLHLQLLEQYAPPSIVVNEEFDILHVSLRAGRYLQIGGGQLSQNLLELIRPELSLELRVALYQAAQLQQTVTSNPIQVNIGDKVETIRMMANPSRQPSGPGRGALLILFQPVDPLEDAGTFTAPSDEPLSRHLEQEIIKLKAQLHFSNEQHNQQSEEMSSSNEELHAMNEELRSAAEELETSKEELQSINEELQTVNQEMKIKIEEIVISNNNFQNLINSAAVGTIFLDRSFRLSLFTPSACEIFNLLPSDRGRPLSDITNHLLYDELLADSEAVLQKLHTIEREVEATDGRTFLMRILPYRTSDDKINGVVITFFNITERKIMETSRQFLASIVESSEDSVVTVDFNSIITSWNRAAEKLYGYNAEAAIGKPLTMLTFPQDLSAVLGNIEMIKNSQKVEIYDTIRIKKDGRHIHLEIVLSPVKDVDGHVIGVSTIARNVTARRHAETALEQLSLRLEIATNAAGMGSWYIDLQSGRTQTDLRHNQLYGYGEPVDGWSRDIQRRHILPEDKARFDAEFAASLTSGNLDIQFRVSWSDGSIHWLYEMGRVFNDGDQEKYITGVTLDITGRKTADESIRLSEELNRIALQSAGMAAWDWNIETDQVRWNEQYSSILGFGDGREDKPSAFFLQFIHPEDFSAVQTQFENSVRNRQDFHAEFRVIRGEAAEIRWISAYGQTIFTEGSRAKRMVGVIYDVTDRKLLEKQKEEFLSVASHELKTPVSSIKAYAQILQRMLEEESNPEKAEMLGKLDAQVNRLIKLIRTLLDNTKVQEGQLALHVESFNLNELIAERLEDLIHLSAYHQLIFNYQAVFTITADRERIGEVLTNLMSNAIKYSPHGGKVIVTCEAVPKGVKVRVKDEGIGIPDELQKKVFARFFRGSYSSSLAIPGLGLGLYISAGIIHRHHGIIAVESELHKGSEFYFILPYSVNELNQEAVQAEAT